MTPSRSSQNIISRCMWSGVIAACRLRAGCCIGALVHHWLACSPVLEKKKKRILSASGFTATLYTSCHGHPASIEARGIHYPGAAARP